MWDTASPDLQIMRAGHIPGQGPHWDFPSQCHLHSLWKKLSVSSKNSPRQFVLNSSVFAALPGTPSSHQALSGALVLIHVLMQMRTYHCHQHPLPEPLCDGESQSVHIMVQPNISSLLWAGITSDSAEIIPLPPAISTPPSVHLFSPCAPEQDAHRLPFRTLPWV